MVEEEKNKILELFNPEGKIILDVGCGNGRYSKVLSETCKKYVGIDIDEDLISRNNKNNKKDNVCFKTENIINYSSEEKYDVIILSLAFHEISIKDQGLALLNMLSLLNKDGEIIILDPALKIDSFQGLYNIAYEYLKYFNHDYTGIFCNSDPLQIMNYSNGPEWFRLFCGEASVYHQLVNYHKEKGYSTKNYNDALECVNSLIKY